MTEQTRSADTDAAVAEEALPTFSEQVADQLGGLRGMIESSLPVMAFVIANVVWELEPALILAVAGAVGIAIYRLSRREPVRHAVNGLVGIGVGALIAWRSGSPKDFYLPGILLSAGYAVAMVGSVATRRPLVGWIWSVVADKGATRWREHPGLRRTFGWLTVRVGGDLSGEGRIAGRGLLHRRPHRGPESQRSRDHSHRPGIPAVRAAVGTHRVGGAATSASRRPHRANRPAAAGLTRRSGSAENDLAHFVLDLDGADEDQFVAGLQRVVRRSGRAPACRAGSPPGRRRGAAVTSRTGVSDVRRGVRQRDLDEVRLRPAGRSSAGPGRRR